MRLRPHFRNNIAFGFLREARALLWFNDWARHGRQGPLPVDQADAFGDTGGALLALHLDGELADELGAIAALLDR